MISGNGQLDFKEFSEGMKAMRIDLKDDDLKKLFKIFDRNGDEQISFDEFFKAIKGGMNQRRKDMVALAFGVLDTSGDGVISLEEITSKYDPKSVPEVAKGKVTPAEALEHFIMQWGKEALEKKRVTRDDFDHYYRDLSTLIDDDDYFELMIRNAWHISGGIGDTENTSNKRFLVKFEDGTEKVLEMKYDLGVNIRDIDDMKRRFERQGVTRIVSIKTGM
jgi:hypothetical protein